MAIKYQLQDVEKLTGKSIFFDANVLIYLFWPTGQYSIEQNYARVFSRLIKQGNKLVIDYLVISEVINSVLRNENSRIDPDKKFKKFRDSQEGKAALSDIHIIVKNHILNKFFVIGKAFSKQDIENFLVVDELDFVDKTIVSLCKENNFVLLTNDKDFKNTDLEILTGNPSILS